MRYLVQVIMRREIRSSPRMITDAAIAAALLPLGVVTALLAVLVAAVGKELWDAQGHGTPDRIDALVSESGLDKVGQRVQTNYESKTNGV